MPLALEYVDYSIMFAGSTRKPYWGSFSGLLLYVNVCHNYQCICWYLNSDIIFQDRWQGETYEGVWEAYGGRYALLLIRDTFLQEYHGAYHMLWTFQLKWKFCWVCSSLLHCFVKLASYLIALLHAHVYHGTTN